MPAAPPDGRHDFDFFHGRWTVENRRLRERFADSDRWASARDGQLGEPALGRFQGGAGTFLGADTHAGRAALTRMVFRDITPDAFVWEQAGSLDGGARWETNWVMRIRRAG